MGLFVTCVARLRAHIQRIGHLPCLEQYVPHGGAVYKVSSIFYFDALSAVTELVITHQISWIEWFDALVRCM